MNDSAFIEDLTWPEVAARIRAGQPVLVPVGAAAKEHAHHLPMNTDWRLARALAEGVAARLPVLVAPILGQGHYPAFVKYPGSQNLGAATFIALMTEILEKLVADGASRIAVINTGVSTEAPLSIATRLVRERTGIRVPTAHIRDLGQKAEAALEQKMGGHACEAETSLMLAIAPETVRMERARRDYGGGEHAPRTVFRQPVTFDGDPASGIDHSATGAFGDPTLATAEKGRAILAEMLEELVSGLCALWPDAFPALEPKAVNS